MSIIMNISNIMYIYSLVLCKTVSIDEKGHIYREYKMVKNKNAYIKIKKEDVKIK